MQDELFNNPLPDQPALSDAQNRVVSDQTAEQFRVVPVIEEQLQIGKQVVETGRVRLVKDVQEETVQVQLPLIHDEVNVERVPIDQYVSEAPTVRYEGDTMIVPVLREIVVTQKHLLLVEELHITKRQVETQYNEPVTVRKESVTVERLPAADALSPLSDGSTE